MGLLDGNGMFCLVVGNGDEVSPQLWKNESATTFAVFSRLAIWPRRSLPSLR